MQDEDMKTRVMKYKTRKDQEKAEELQGKREELSRSIIISARSRWCQKCVRQISAYKTRVDTAHTMHAAAFIHSSKM